MAKKKKIEKCLNCDQEQCVCVELSKALQDEIKEAKLTLIPGFPDKEQIVPNIIIEEPVIEKTDKQIKVEYYLNHFLKPGWESGRIINSSMIDTLGFKDRKFNNTFRKEYTNLTGLTSAGCECLKTYIRLLQKLLNMYNEK